MRGHGDLASIPHGTFVEFFHPDRDPIWWNLVENREPVVNGPMRLSEAPGLGWVPDVHRPLPHRSMNSASHPVNIGI